MIIFQNKMVKVTFVGTLPIITDGTDIFERDYWKIEEWKVQGWVTSPSFSVFDDVKQFLSENQIEYYFLHYGTIGTFGYKLDPKYDSHTVLADLRIPLSQDKIDILKNSDIVYIDSNTLGYIDYEKTAEEWVDMFAPLVAPKGCIIVDDDRDNFPFPIRKGINYRNEYLRNKVYHGFTSRILPLHPKDVKFENVGSKFNLKGFLKSFIKICKREYPTVLFKVEGIKDGTYEGYDSMLFKQQSTYALE